MISSTLQYQRESQLNKVNKQIKINLDKKVEESWKSFLFSKISRCSKHNDGETASFRHIVLSCKRVISKRRSFLNVPWSRFHVLSCNTQTTLLAPYGQETQLSKSNKNERIITQLAVQDSIKSSRQAWEKLSPKQKEQR